MIISDEAGQRSDFPRWFRLACDLRSIKAAINLLLLRTEATSAFKASAAHYVIVHTRRYSRDAGSISRIPMFLLGVKAEDVL